MATSAAAAPAASEEGDVFLNVPYDKQYGPLFVALIAGLVALGRSPRCALEAQSRGRRRIDEVYNLLARSGSSIHDLSRVNLSGSFQVPRFNMPFELGIAFGLAQTSGHKLFVFEEVEFRSQASLSDMNGFDPLVHGGTQDGVLSRILDCFATGGRLPRLAKLRAVTKRLSLVAAKAQSEQNSEDPFRPYIFKLLVAAALQSAQPKRLQRGTDPARS